MNGLIETAVAVGLLALVAALAWLLVSAWRKVLQDDAVRPFFRALERVGVAPERFEGTWESEQFARAARRCTFCDHKMECLAALAADPGCRFLRFCPNADFFVRACAAINRASSDRRTRSASGR